VTNIPEQLKTICADKTLGYQRLLRETTLLFRSVALDRPWTEVDSLLNRQGIRQEIAFTNEYTTKYRSLITKGGWRADDGTPYSLYVEFAVDRRSANTVARAKPGFVIVAAAGLAAKPNVPHTQTLANSAYPNNSILFRALRLPEATATAKSYPILKQVEVTYDLIRGFNFEIVECGFKIDLTFGDSVTGDRRGKSIYFTAASGLDPPQDWSGKAVATQFEERDTVGEFQIRGSSEWKRAE
jgi:hypothetical protein